MPEIKKNQLGSDHDIQIKSWQNAQILTCRVSVSKFQVSASKITLSTASLV